MDAGCRGGPWNHTSRIHSSLWFGLGSKSTLVEVFLVKCFGEQINDLVIEYFTATYAIFPHFVPGNIKYFLLQNSFT